MIKELASQRELNMQLIKPFFDSFQAYLTLQQFSKAPTGLYEPIDYIMNLGGKRIRPVMLLMSYQLFKDDFETALPAAYAVELFHNFSLVHDDIMDCAPLRRGKPTVHQKWNINTGILSGDVMLVYVYEYLLKLKDQSRFSSILATFNRAAIEVCEGQQYDMNFEQESEVTIASYLNMIELKTSVLLAAGMKMGALYAGASEENAEHLYQFGKNIGIAFQIQDDYLDTFGNPEKFGKKVGGDIVQNKKTYLVIKALEVADNSTRTTLFNWLSNTHQNEEEKIVAVKEIFERLHVPSLTKQAKEYFQNQAFEHLKAVEIAEDRKLAIIQIADELLEREI